MHIIEIQYLTDYFNNSKNTAMHDLKAIYDKVFNTLKHVAKEYFVHGENHRFYPNPPLMSDLQIVSLAITAECTQVPSENLVMDEDS